MKSVLSTLEGVLAKEGQPWGDDSTGHDFADGPDGYLAQKEGVVGSINAKTQLLDQYATQLADAANTMQQQDGD